MSQTATFHKPRIKEFNILQQDKTSLLYDRETLELRPISNEAAKAFSEVLDHVDNLETDSSAWRYVDEIVEHYSRLPALELGFRAISELPCAVNEPVNASANPGRNLNKLAINVANDCNLGCTYCYANQGLYGTPVRQLISEDQIEKIITRFAEQYDSIKYVQFMGGEPSINPCAIQRAGEVFERLVEEGKLAAMPIFTTVTNALAFSRHFMSTAQRYNLQLTISLDGPKAINDSVRMRKSGMGSYDAIRRNISKARDAGLTVGFQATFSKQHLNYGCSLIDLCQWFFDEFGVRTLHAPPMTQNRYGTEALALSNEEKIQQYSAVMEWGVDNLLARGEYLMHSFTARLLDSFTQRRKNRHICPAGNSLLSVSTQGEVYPCWMHTDERPFYMGTVDEDFLGNTARDVLARMNEYELHSHPECRQCLIQPVCFGCKGGDYHATNSLDEKTECDYMRAMVASFIMRLFSPGEASLSATDYLERATFGEKVWRSLRPSYTPESTPAWGNTISPANFIPLSSLV